MSKNEHKATSTVVAQINSINIVMVQNGEKRIAIKPICEVLGVNYSTQLEKLKNDDFLKSVVSLRGTTGSDGKEYQMMTIPYMYVFGWLFTINPKNVREEARETVLKYKMECYQALFNHFTSQNDFLQDKQALLEEKIENVNRISHEFSSAKDRLKDAKTELNQAKELTFESWKSTKMQTSIEFPSQQEGGLQ